MIPSDVTMKMTYAILGYIERGSRNRAIYHTF